MAVHASSIVSPGAQLGAGVEVGPFTLIGSHVQIGAGTRIGSHVVLDGHTQIGERCEIFAGACIGTPPQDKKYKDQISRILIGNENVLREYVTIHRGSTEGARTVIGDRNYLMVGCHVGHDCHIGNDVTMANGTILGGHARIEDLAVLGGYSGVHQFVRIGKLAMLGAFSKAVMDVPPYALCDGYPARLFGLNSIGLKRAGYPSKTTLALKRAYKILFMSGLTFAHALKRIEAEIEPEDVIQHLLSFVENSKRGVLRASGRTEE